MTRELAAQSRAKTVSLMKSSTVKCALLVDGVASLCCLSELIRFHREYSSLQPLSVSYFLTSDDAVGCPRDP